MFRGSKAEEISAFFAVPIQKNEIAFFYLGVSGFIIRSSDSAVLVDPAGMLKSEEVNRLKDIRLVLFSHDHLDHFSSGKTEELFKATAAPVLAEAKVTNKLKGRIPSDQIFTAQNGKTYRLNGVEVTAIEGIHRGQIILFQITMDGTKIFHGGDSGYVNLKEYPSDIAIVPVGRMSPTASPENAYKMVADVKPQVAVTMHGSNKQKRELEEKVKKSMPQTTVYIMTDFSSKVVSLPTEP